MILNYTINSTKDLELLPLLKTAQFTLNPHQSPQKRVNTIKALESIKKYQTEMFAHYDYYRTVPRYLS